MLLPPKSSGIYSEIQTCYFGLSQIKMAPKTGKAKPHRAKGEKKKKDEKG